MNKKLPYFIALSAFAVCLPAVSQAQIAKGAARAIKGGKSAVKLTRTPMDPGLKLRVERAIAEQKTYTWGRRLYQRTPQEAAQVALNTAIYAGENDLIKPLLKKGAQLNLVLDDGNTPLTIATLLGNLETVKELLQNGVDINMPDHLSRTPLIRATNKYNYDMVKLLLDNGAKVDLQDDRGFTALMHTGNEKIVKLLLDNGADPNHQDEGGWTPLMRVIYKNEKRSNENDIKLATLLLENGAKINLQNNRGETALILALDVRNFAMTKLLLEHGADPYIVDDQGRDAFSVARWAAYHRRRYDLFNLLNLYRK